MTHSNAQYFQTGRKLTKEELCAVVGGNMIKGTYGDDDMQGTSGNDTMGGWHGNDIVSGGDGDDKLYGNNGNDTLNGEDGNDSLHGGRGDDILNGGDGDDLLYGGRGDDIAGGGAGDDTYVWKASNNGNDSFDGGPGNDQIVLAGIPGGSIQYAVEAGLLTIELTDANGNPIAITNEMWNQNGGLTLPEETCGTITSWHGEVLTFTDVESISKH